MLQSLITKIKLNIDHALPIKVFGWLSASPWNSVFIKSSHAVVVNLLFANECKKIIRFCSSKYVKPAFFELNSCIIKELFHLLIRVWANLESCDDLLHRLQWRFLIVNVFGVRNFVVIYSHFDYNAIHKVLNLFRRLATVPIWRCICTFYKGKF